MNSLRVQLKLEPDVAEVIEAEVLQPYREYQRKLQEYEQTLVEAVQAESPLSQRTLDDLKDYQHHLALEDADIKPIQEKVMSAAPAHTVAAPESCSSNRSSIPTYSKQIPSKSQLGYEKFTDKSIKAIFLAQEESKRLGHSWVGSEQILLGLIGEGTDVAAKTLKSEGIKLKDARVAVEQIIGRGPGSVTANLPFTPRAKRVLELSLQEARRLGHNYIGTEHLLLGLTKEGEGVGARVLEILGADLQRLRDLVLQTINT